MIVFKLGFLDKHLVPPHNHTIGWVIVEAVIGWSGFAGKEPKTF